MDIPLTTSDSQLSTLYDLIIIGGGPAGVSASVYAARKKLKTLLVLKEWGGQSTVSDDIQNWIGTPHISGADLAKSFKSHVLEYKGDTLSIKEGKVISAISGNAGNFTVTLENEESFKSKTILIATGSSRRKLDIKGADIFENKGITYCASCDGPLFSGMPVVVIGGGNAGFESAAQLLAYCKSVTLLSRSEPKADAITIEKLKSNKNFNLIIGATPKEVSGRSFVESITYTDSDGKDIVLPTSGIFVEIGQIPATKFAESIVELNSFGQVVIDPRNQETKTKGVWSAGDCTDVLYHQNNIASGDAVRAIEDIYLHLNA